MDPVPVEQEPSFWARLWAGMKTTFRWMGEKLLGPGVALLVVALALVLVAMGVCSGARTLSRRRLTSRTRLLQAVWMRTAT